MRVWGRGLALLGLMLSLGACRDAASGDLDRELAALRAAPGELTLEPLPPMPVYHAVDYRFADRRSPFQARLPESRALPEGDAELAPDRSRSREPLEAYELGQLELVGTLTVGGTPSALIRAPGGKVHRLRVGDHMGSDFGRIVGITSASVQLVEIVPTGGGGWIERSTQLSLDG
ncbi:MULTISPECIES: pilus assembly protein PilP [Halomonas]|uniref:Type 4 fimbrial biogenesis protein PilP n=1 Tax=Halomonas halophila TaxID=29573 RepID=A0ABQ0U2R4_9GAMM|nr:MULTISPECIES: pilus assembly protein PilP [Halomonas]MDR5890058.1 pilus assembly protein PilP [Halomonas salina]RAH39254.1 pilus assembly protein PilQ [Halomonas sp. SL1]WJY06838.1 pilus assembly protein PilP [Halomonas halophila]GEK72738.1 type 4 fimbrial biogenesis protein PilP [Halomonas halophila]